MHLCWSIQVTAQTSKIWPKDCIAYIQYHSLSQACESYKPRALEAGLRGRSSLLKHNLPQVMFPGKLKWCQLLSGSGGIGGGDSVFNSHASTVKTHRSFFPLGHWLYPWITEIYFNTEVVLYSKAIWIFSFFLKLYFTNILKLCLVIFYVFPLKDSQKRKVNRT